MRRCSYDTDRSMDMEDRLQRAVLLALTVAVFGSPALATATARHDFDGDGRSDLLCAE